MSKQQHFYNTFLYQSLPIDQYVTYWLTFKDQPLLTSSNKYTQFTLMTNEVEIKPIKFNHKPVKMAATTGHC